MAKPYRFTFLAFCTASLFVGSAWAGEGGAVLAKPVIGAEAPLFTPAPELKIGGCRTRCIGSYATSTNGASSAWGMGSNCSAAQADLDAFLFNQADQNCLALGTDGACSVTTVVTTPCYWNGYSYQFSGYANYRCFVTTCIEPPPPY